MFLPVVACQTIMGWETTEVTADAAAAGFGGDASSGGAGAGGTGAGGTGGIGGTGGASGTGGTGGSLECAPTKMVPISGYQIDATEVTRCQYAQWLALNPPTVGQIADCAWNDDFEPSYITLPPSAEHMNRPMIGVDWCDAYAYCKAAGKRLCGAIGGGASDYSLYDSHSQSQWHNACTSGGANEYPYGDEFESGACQGEDADEPVDVGTLDTCQSSEDGYQGVFDMVGNVREWEDSCDFPDAGEAACCRVRGGGHFDKEENLRCDDDNCYSRNDRKDMVGFRCCS